MSVVFLGLDQVSDCTQRLFVFPLLRMTPINWVIVQNVFIGFYFLFKFL